jgi:glycosyltransferase involved in cell wall biosynthesis
MNKLCCLLPVYKNDNPNYFKLSIESILNQSHKSDLYVLCDGPLTIELENILNFIIINYIF